MGPMSICLTKTANQKASTCRRSIENSTFIRIPWHWGKFTTVPLLTLWSVFPLEPITNFSPWIVTVFNIFPKIQCKCFFHIMFATVHYCLIVINLVGVTKQGAGPYMKFQIRKLDPQCQCIWGKLFLIVPTTNRCISYNSHTAVQSRQQVFFCLQIIINM